MKFRVRGDIAKLVRHKRDVPGDFRELAGMLAWARYIEPRLQRGSVYRDCWFWTGAVTAKGEPKLDIIDETKPIGNKRTHVRVKRLVANLFCDTDRCAAGWDVIHICGNLPCLNPRHLMICLDHWKQRDADEIRSILEAGTYYVP